MLQMNSIFSDGMVLQRQKKVRIFGEAQPGQTVTAKIPERQIQAAAQADASGAFTLMLPEQEAGDACTLVVTAGGESLTFQNVKYGEVWFAGGQSNMELELGNCAQGPEELAWIAQERSRSGKEMEVYFYYTVKAPYCDAEWTKKRKHAHWCSVSESSGHTVSAVAYFAAKRLQEKLKVPVGIINCNHGGTSVACWMTQEELNTFANGRWYLEQYAALVGDKTDAQYLNEMEVYRETLRQYLDRVDAIRSEAVARKETITAEQMNELAGPYPWPEPQGWLSPYRPGGLAQTMFSYVAPYTVRGVWYYQGEEDSSRWQRYADMLRHLITAWRAAFQEQLAFFVLQLPMFLEKGADEDGSWVGIRQAQAQVSSQMQEVYLVPLCDLGEYDNVHPVDKRTPGNRLGGITLRRIYGCQEESLAMTFAGSFAEAGTLTVYFNHSEGGICVGTAPQGEEPRWIPAEQAKQEGVRIAGFEVAGADGRFCPADAYVEREFVILSSPDVPSPLLARYAWANFTRANVYNKKGLPLAPFLG